MRGRRVRLFASALLGLVISVLILWPTVAAGQPAATQTATTQPARPQIDRLNRAFLEHVGTLGPDYARTAEAVREAWQSYQQSMPQSFVPDALALLYADYREALDAFDEQRYGDMQRLAGPLRESRDPFLAANAQYLYARALIEQGLLEEAEDELRNAVGPAAGRPEALEQYTPYASHLRFMRAYCEASNLRFAEALQTLQSLEAEVPDAPEPVQAGARQLRLEIERRERGTLDEVAMLMSYSAARLTVADATQRVRSRQDEAVALLDKLVEEAQEREKSHDGAGQRRAAQDKRPGAPRERSEAPESGAAPIGELHRAPAADPSQMWGQLPPAQRERILDSLRDRFPSRYRQLVEQYYRSLAEER
jgi:tetratricopeptide (TPR) repeat protein